MARKMVMNGDKPIIVDNTVVQPHQWYEVDVEEPVEEESTEDSQGKKEVKKKVGA